ncbi:uncharacterized protein F5147DRAFT_783177 [Suillus discolor]|uniref:Uncharacterized protein n=1 Tax=Suillus discolor TaxID=1912936 RepID=A0A9P7JKX8_9AGAM|nr:uncharacterized protein F5147DRAFT_783177 [Suillus discolor]KAG2082782.1 hypothetical protein F5147DRAFT_783177 [Suillus discolor]
MRGDPAIKVDTKLMDLSCTLLTEGGQNFIPKLRDHVLYRLRRLDISYCDHTFTDEERNVVIIPNNTIYSVQTMQICYTTYDLRREYDSINPRTHGDVMVLSGESMPSHPYWYARVLGIYHTEVWLTGNGGSKPSKQRLEVLWVRWLAVLQGYRSGTRHARLPKIAFVEESDPDVFGFLDPGQVVRGAHLLPTFASGRGISSLRQGKSLAHPGEQLDDWEEYYVGIFVNRDMFMQYTHLGVGHSIALRRIARDCFGSQSATQSDTMDIVNDEDAHGEDGADGNDGNGEGFEEFDEEGEDSDEGKELVGLQKQGPDKDMAQCKRKWQALKQIYNAIERYRNNRLGCHWDNVNGANIQGEAAELQWNQFITANNSNKRFSQTGVVLRGAATYNPASLAAEASAAIPVNSEAGGSSLSVQASDGPIAEASGSGLEVAAVPQAGWDQIESALPSVTPGVARSSMNIPPPSSSIAPSSMGKRSHSDMIMSPSTAQTTMSLVDSSHASNVDKKPKLLTHGKSQAARSRKGSRAAKDTASTAVFMNLQGSINSLTDSLRKSASNTDQNKTRVLDERLEAVLAMQEEELISEDESVTLMNMFARSPAVCSIYLAAKPERQIPYLQSVLDQAARGEFGVF